MRVCKCALHPFPHALTLHLLICLPTLFPSLSFQLVLAALAKQDQNNSNHASSPSSSADAAATSGTISDQKIDQTHSELPLAVLPSLHEDREVIKLLYLLGILLIIFFRETLEFFIFRSYSPPHLKKVSIPFE